ncbi:MAG: Fic family protein [Bacilli bacterium]
MEAYKAKKLPLEYDLSTGLLKLLCETQEIYGEYKGYLRNMAYDYKCFLESAFVSELFYSFKIDGSKLNKEYMFHYPYMVKNNDTIQFSNLKRALFITLDDVVKNNFSLNGINKINKILFSNCSKNNKTKNSGKLRNTQNFLLKPGLAGSVVSFIPPVHTELNSNMKNLVEYMNKNDDNSLIAVSISHYQYEKIHPYVSGNGKIGRILIPIQYSFYKNEPPILFISEALDKLKNTYFTLLSGEVNDDVNAFIKFMLQCIIEQCNLNIKKIKKLNKVYKKDLDEFKDTIGGTTIYKVLPIMLKKVVFTTHDIVEECNLHINSVNKVLNKLVEQGYLIKEKKKGTNRVTFCYKSIYDIFTT